MNTFLLAAFAASISLTNSTMLPLDVLFLMTYSSIQLCEYFLWKNIDNASANHFYSVVTFIVLLVQPLVSILRMHDHWNTMILMLCMYAVLLFLVLLRVQNMKFQATVAKNGHLIWHWLDRQWWLVVPWIVLLILPIYYTYGISITLVFVLVALAVSLISYGRDNTWGSMWCWFGAIASVYYIGIAFYKAGWCST
jgi:hypothetical protein